MPRPRCLPLALLAALLLGLARSPSFALPGARRQLLAAAVAPLVAGAAARAEEEIPLGSIPKDLQAKEVGQQVTTPHGVVYEPLELGTEEQGPRSGPPRGGSTVILKYTARLDGWNGPIFDSSTLRGQRKPNKVDFIESRLNVDPSLPNCIFEAVKLMKVGAKGRATCPPKVSYSEGKVAFDADEQGEVQKVPAGATLYYDLELVRIIKP